MEDPHPYIGAGELNDSGVGFKYGSFTIGKGIVYRTEHPSNNLKQMVRDKVYPQKQTGGFLAPISFTECPVVGVKSYCTYIRW